MGLFYSQVLKASALLVKAIKVGEHLLIAYESNAHVPCLRPLCAQSCGLEMVQSLGVHNVGPSCSVSSSVWCFFVCEGSGSESWRAWSSLWLHLQSIQVMVIHSFQMKNLMWQSIHNSTRHVSLCRSFCLDFVLDSLAFLIWWWAIEITLHPSDFKQNLIW
jgi:hypothetical protein